MFLLLLKSLLDTGLSFLPSSVCVDHVVAVIGFVMDVSYTCKLEPFKMNLLRDLKFRSLETI